MKPKIKFIRYEITDNGAIDNPLILGVDLKVKATIFMKDNSSTTIKLDNRHDWKQFYIPIEFTKKYFNIDVDDVDKFNDLHTIINNELQKGYKKLLKKITNIKQEGVIKF